MAFCGCAYTKTGKRVKSCPAHKGTKGAGYKGRSRWFKGKKKKYALKIAALRKVQAALKKRGKDKTLVQIQKDLKKIKRAGSKAPKKVAASPRPRQKKAQEPGPAAAQG